MPAEVGMFMLQVMGIPSELGWAGCVALEQDPQRVSSPSLATRCRLGRTSAWGQLPQGGCSGCRSVVSVALDAPAKGKQPDGQIDLSQQLRNHLGEWGY